MEVACFSEVPSTGHSHCWPVPYGKHFGVLVVIEEVIASVLHLSGVRGSH